MITRPDLGSDRTERLSCLFREQAHLIYAYAFRRLHSREDAEDLVADVFLAAWREVDNLPREPLPWLLAVARHRLADGWRQARRHGRLCRRLELEIPAAPADECPRPPEDAPESLVPVLAALAQLGEPDREALILTYWDGLSGQEAARVMGLNPAAFRMRLGRARRRLVEETENQHEM